jgi:hypothetical protein
MLEIPFKQQQLLFAWAVLETRIDDGDGAMPTFEIQTPPRLQLHISSFVALQTFTFNSTAGQYTDKKGTF